MRLLPPFVLAALACAALSGPALASDEARLLVKFRAGTDAAAVAETLADAGAERDGRVPGLGVLVVSAESDEARAALAELRSSPDVLYAERDGLVAVDRVPSDPFSGASFWQHVLPRFHGAWDLATGSADVVVAVLDTGVSPVHPDLGPLAPGYDFVNGDAAPDDDQGHGTAVAGIVAARGDNARGIAGACWRCTIMPVKVMDESGFGTWSTVANGLVWATDHGADVANLSLGGGSGSPTLSAAVAYAVERGVVVVASAGNTGLTTLRYPANYPGVLAVAASDEHDKLYSFSTHGSWVEVAAPGCTTTTHRGGGYTSFCGTSAAAPFVAGLAGLALSFAPAASGDEIASALLGTATPVAGVAHGRVEARATLASLAHLASIPVSVERPRIRGPKRVGALVEARAGAWAGTVLSYRYRWQRCRGARCVLVGRGETYKVRGRDIGRRLRLVVVARGETGDRIARSHRTRLVRSPAS